MNEIIKKDGEFIMHTYNRFGVVLDKGKNATVYDDSGRELIDFGSGIGVNSLGYCNDGWINAVTTQLNALHHASNLYYTVPAVMLAEKLCLATHMDKALLCNSGAEANEAAIKLARKYSHDKYGDGRNKILSLKNSFHGRTMATLTATGQEVFHQHFFPFLEGHIYAETNIESIEKSIDKSVCAVMIEMIQGEGGVVPLDNSFVHKINETCKERDILLIVDEVQTGIARTGKLLCYEWYGIEPDIVTLAKGLGGGLPIGACLSGNKCALTFGFGDHGTTFGGNPVVAAGANYILDTVNNDEFLNCVIKKSNYIINQLNNIPNVTGVTGKGLMLGISIKDGLSSRQAAENALNNGLMVLTAKNKIRLLPPLTITYEEIDKGLHILEEVLNY